MSDDAEDVPEPVEAIAGELDIDPSEIDREPHMVGESDEKSGKGEITIHAKCPECYEPMSLNTVVDQEDRDRNGRTRYEAVCGDCQMGMILTVVQTVNDVTELFGHNTPDCDWDIEALGEPYEDRDDES